MRLAQHRWIIEPRLRELKQELGLGHYEGRGWGGFHHHATLCIAAYGYLVIERTRYSPSARAGRLELCTARIPPEFQPRGSPRAAEPHNPQSIATLRIKIARALIRQLPCCPLCCTFRDNTVVLVAGSRRYLAVNRGQRICTPWRSISR
ncbi:MAG: hypothetical protein KIT09_00910 [Bryobacteraceae bacterium]|nr:hypothetical protein [Bryobacteraceae bacterium]